MLHNEAEIKRIAGINDIHQYRHAKTDGNLLREHLTQKKVKSISLGTISNINTIVLILNPVPNMIVADYIYEQDKIYDFLLKIIKDILIKHQKIKYFNFNPVNGVCEVILLENKPGAIELVKFRFTDGCIKAQQSDRLYRVANFNNRPWFIHKLPNESDKINFLSLDGTISDMLTCNCFFSATEKKCVHKTLVRKYLNEVMNIK